MVNLLIKAPSPPSVTACMIPPGGASASHVILALLLASPAALSTTTPTYWIGHGQYTADSCQSATCDLCPVTQYKSNCGGSSGGSCVDCSTASTLPANAHWTQAGFSAPCPWACNPPFVLTNGACNTVYSISVTIAVGVTVSQAQSDIAKLLAPIATLSNCGTCNYGTFPAQIQCDSCYITAVLSDITSRRRLLGSATQIGVNVVTSGGQGQAQTAASQLTVSNINTQLSNSGYQNSVSVTAAAAVASQTITPPTTSQTTPAPTTTPHPAAATTPAPSDSSNSTGAVAGAVVGVLFGLIIIGLVVYCLVSRRQGVVVQQTSQSNGIYRLPAVPPYQPPPPYGGVPIPTAIPAQPLPTATPAHSAFVNAQIGFPPYIGMNTQYQSTQGHPQHLQQRQRFHSLPVKLRY